MWMGAWSLIADWIDERFAVAKITGSCRFVIRSVFEGVAGCVSGGKSERSIERFGEWRRVGDDAPVGGVDISMAMADSCVGSQSSS